MFDMIARTNIAGGYVALPYIHRVLLGFVGWPSTGPRLTLRGELAEVFGATLRRDAAALLAQDSCWREIRLIDKIVGKRERRAEKFTSAFGATLWKFGCG